MNKTFQVGKGFGKRNLSSALNESKSGDIILVEPGDYFIDGEAINISSKKLTIEGINGNAKTINIYTRIYLSENSFLTLNNLTLNTQVTHNGIYSSGSKLLLNQVIIRHLPNEVNGQDTYPIIYTENSEIFIGKSEIYSKDPSNPYSICSEKTKIKIDGSIIDSFYLADNTKCFIDRTQILSSLHIFSESSVHSNTYIDLRCVDTGIYSLYVEKSVCKLKEVSLSNRPLNSEIVDGLLTIERLENDYPLTFVCKYNDQSSVSVTGDSNLINLTNTDEIKRQQLLNEVSNTSEEVEEKQQLDIEDNYESNESIIDDFNEERIDNSLTNNEEELIDESSDINISSSLSKLDELMGLEVAKEQIKQLVINTQFQKSRIDQGLKATPISLHSVFLGNPGTGKTTVARLLGEILYQSGVIKEDKFIEVSRNDLVSQYIGGTAKDTQAILEQAKGGILFIDEAYMLYSDKPSDTGSEAVDTILKFMEDNRDDIMIIFAGYKKEMSNFMNMNPGLKSRVPHTFDFEDYSPEEIAEIGYRHLLSNDFLVDEEVYKKLVVNEYLKVIDNSNARWVRNFNEKLILAMGNRVIRQNISDNQTITEEDLHTVCGGNQESKEKIQQEVLAQLDSLEGLQDVKEYVKNLFYQVKIDKMLEEKGEKPEKNTYHMLFTGNPGTGKTTIANILAKLFFSIDILPTDNVVVVDRSDLVGSYIGHTEKNTKSIIEQSMGGVLFIDEAYQLTVDSSPNDFGKQAVETLITELENNRDKFIVILAGYTNEMAKFMRTNPGLKSRIPNTIEFPDYSAREVATIAKYIVAKTWKFDETFFIESVSNTYNQQPVDSQANGRWARNYAEKLIQNHKVWLAQNLEKGDIDLYQINNELITMTSHQFLNKN